jgi:5-dehydro-2-deoxygluconokinase
MILIMCDLIADISMRLSKFPVQSGGIQRLSYLELGPGGATNVAIMAARFGLSVGCMGELADDHIGELVLDGLRNEGIDITEVVITPGASTPAAGVLVDTAGEPAYLGHPGELRIMELPEAWRKPIQSAEALFCNGWAEHNGVPKIVLEGFQLARSFGVPTFFDPGPGNPAIDRDWWEDAILQTTVLLATESEARDITGVDDPLVSARHLLTKGPEMVVLKRGTAGCLLLTEDEEQIAPGFPVQVRDATGAGDCLDAVVIYGYLRGMSLPELGSLANAAGAAKVRKLGTGHNMPTIAEIKEILERFDISPSGLLPD